MHLPLSLSIVLILAGIWPILVWPQFLRRVSKDERARDENGKATKFLTVHIFLVIISMTLGAATLVIGIRALF